MSDYADPGHYFGVISSRLVAMEHNKALTGCFHCAEFMRMDEWLDHMRHHCVFCEDCKRVWDKWNVMKEAEQAGLLSLED